MSCGKNSSGVTPPSTTKLQVEFAVSDAEDTCAADPEDACAADPEDACAADPEDACAADPEAAGAALLSLIQPWGVYPRIFGTCSERFSQYSIPFFQLSQMMLQYNSPQVQFFPCPVLLQPLFLRLSAHPHDPKLETIFLFWPCTKRDNSDKAVR